MCGFSAVLYTSGSAPPEVIEADLQKSLGYLTHRGPDSSGIYVNPAGTVGLGHVRLSIIDLATSQQPLSDEDDKIWAVVTGELYDFERVRGELKAKGAVFKTNGDSELLIQLYKIHGLNAVLELRGEFAFVLWDDRRKQLYVGRDRFGIKPLYFLETGQKLLIASEIKAFIPMGWKPEWDVSSIMSFGQSHDDRTNFKGVRKLPAGHYMVARKHSPLVVRPYWDYSFPDAQQPEMRSIDEMVQGVREHLVESVRLRLRSDVPLGIYLSGGLDSSSLLGIASYLLKKENPGAKVTAFTLSFPSDNGEESAYDEGPIAKRSADAVGADMKVLRPSEQDLIEAFERGIWHSELALSDLGGAAKHLLSALVQKEGYRVVLTGEGADEVAAGYAMFLGDYLRAPDVASSSLGIDLPTDEERLRMLTELESNPLDMGMTHMSYDDSKVARSILGGISTHRHFAVAVPPSELFTAAAREQAGEIDGAATIAENISGVARANAVDGTWHPLHVALYAEGKSTLANVLLNQLGDRNEMAHSIEGRLPFLDHKLAEYLNGLPPSVKIRPVKQDDGSWAFVEKWILREAVKPFITEELYRRKKAMFTAPLKEKSDKPSKEDEGGKSQPQPIVAMLTKQLTRDNIDALGFIDADQVEKQFQLYLSGDWTAGYGGLPRCLRICLLVYSLIILGKRFGVARWEADVEQHSRVNGN